MTTTKQRRIDSLAPARLRVRVPRTLRERVVFLGIEGEGDDRRAKFVSIHSGGHKTYEWEAYRYNGGWAFGTSAQRLALTDVWA